MDEAYRRWRPPKSHSSFRRRALVFIGYVCHRFRRAFVKVFWRRHINQSVVNSFVISSRDATGLYYRSLSTDCSPLYNRVSDVNVLRSSVNHSLGFSQSGLHSNYIESFLFGACSSGALVSIVLWL